MKEGYSIDNMTHALSTDGMQTCELTSDIPMRAPYEEDQTYEQT